MNKNDETIVSTVLTVRELSTMLRIGINAAYRLVRSGVIHSVRVGRQYRIPRSAVDKYLSEKEGISA